MKHLKYFFVGLLVTAVCVGIFLALVWGLFWLSQYQGLGHAIVHGLLWVGKALAITLGVLVMLAQTYSIGCRVVTGHNWEPF